MSVNAISKDTQDIVDRMMSTAVNVDVNSAIAVLDQSELTNDQKAKIAGILNEPRSDNQEQAMAAMRKRIVAVVENVASAAPSSQAPSEQRCVTFTDVTTSPFGNASPCAFEFGGKHYKNATACFLAQQYTDQPEIMNRFTNLGPEEATALAELTPMTKKRKTSWENPGVEPHEKIVLENVAKAANDSPCALAFEGKQYQDPYACFLAQKYTDQPEIMNLFTNLSSEEAIALAELTPMTKERKISWENDAKLNKDNVLKNVLRAKFEHNLDLKKQLLATGDAYLVCHGYGLYLCDNMNGTGKNALGTSLMCLRGEYGGTGPVAPPTAYLSANQSLQLSSRFFGVELPSDIMGRLFNGYISGNDFKTLGAVSCVNKYWNNFSTNFWETCDRNSLCPELTILDAETQGEKCDDEPKISKFRLIKGVREIAPHVEGDAGVTLLTMRKGTTFNQLMEIAKDEGLDVTLISCHDDVKDLGDVVEQSYRILITNSVFKKSRNINFDSQVILVDGHGCKMPAVPEYVALCVYTYKAFKKCLYGHDPITYGRSSTKLEFWPFSVGNFSRAIPDRAPARFSISPDSCYYKEFDDEGAGGQRRV